MDAKLFQKILNSLALGDVNRVAVAVSGGPDSMALAYMLAHFTDLDVHMLSVDHGLRAAAADELVLVGEQAHDWGTTFAPLKWQHDGVDSRLHEEARAARYDLMSVYCCEQGIAHLFLGHHMDDQAETFLFRLAKGSGLDGLASMRGVQDYDDVQFVRPLLQYSKEELVTFCDAHNIRCVCDPSNDDEAYARVRIRKARGVLEEEGLSAKRLAVTAARLARAREALEELTDRIYEVCASNKNPERIVFNFGIMREEPEEIVLRCVLKALAHFRPAADYAPRMEKVEDLVRDLLTEPAFRKRTLGGVIFERDNARKQLILTLETG